MLDVLRSPRWILGHVVAIAAVVGFVLLGSWQLSRLDERRAYNALLEDRAAAAPLTDADLTDVSDPDRVAYRRAELTGTFDAAEELLLSTRAREGRPGHHVLTPLRTEAGPVVLVDRGWVPFEWDTAPVEQAPPPPGSVTVRGILLPPEPHGRVVRAQDGAVRFLTGVDLDELGDAARHLIPLYLMATDLDQGAGRLPAPGTPPEPTEGNHLSYALQWFMFAGVVVVGYPLLLRRAARERSAAHQEGDERPRPG